MNYFQQIYSRITTGHKRSVKAKKNIIYSFFLKSISIIIGIILVPLVLSYLDIERYGIWLTLSSIIAWFSFFDIGLSNGLRNRFAEAIADNNTSLAKTYVSTTYAILGILFICLLFIFFIINPHLNWQRIINTTIVDNHELSLIAKIVFLFFIIRFFLKSIGSILLADQRPAINNLFNPASNVLSLIIIFILIKTTQGSLILLSATFSITPVIIFLIATIYFFNKDYKSVRPNINYINLNKSKDLLGLGFNFFIIQIAAIILFTSNNIIITQFFSPIEVTKYNIAFRYFNVMFLLFTIITTPFWSAFTEAYHTKDIKWIKITVTKLFKIWRYIALGIILMLIVSKYIYQLWIGTEIQIPFILSLSLAMFTLIITFNSIYIFFLNGIGKIRIQLYHSIFIILVNIPLSIFLIKFTNLGFSSVVWANIICQMIVFYWAPTQYKKIINNTAKGIWNK